MAKVKAKKKNLKLRRQIRKTVGALFMVSAIVIAAIPVENLSAADPDAPVTGGDTPGGGTGTGGNLSYVQYPDAASVEADETLVDNFAAANNIDSRTILDSSGKTEYTSYSVRRLSDGSYSLNWQFKYFLSDIGGGNRAVISSYNNVYLESEMRLGNSAQTNYYMVTEDQYNAFYGAGGQGNQTYELTYAKWQTGENEASGAVRWFQTYEGERYKAFNDACVAYEASIAANPDDPDKQLQMPSPVIINPANPESSNGYSEEKRRSYYCEFQHYTNNTLPGGGYTLVPVTDNTAGAAGGGSSNPPASGGNATQVYLAQGGEPITPAYNDSFGFLVTNQSVEVIGIADEVFKGIINVDTLTIPREIRYIGNSAFENSFLKKIILEDVNYIGHYAFKDCSQLTEIELNNTQVIGVEAFRHSGLSSVVLPNSVGKIGTGAFAYCDGLKNVDMNAITSTCDIDRYAFYNDYALDSVGMASNSIRSIGEAAFALSNTQTGGWAEAVLPPMITGSSTSSLGDYLFAGRNNLNSVTFPTAYGNDGPVTVPKGMFRGCTNLGCADFTAARGSTLCGNVSFDRDIFADVLNADFLVKGPEYDANGQEASPRKSTWYVTTRASNMVPYVYINSQGTTCYEVSDGDYILQANDRKELTSCRLNPEGTTGSTIDLVIPRKVGNYEIETIANGAMSNDELREKIRSITIQDESLTGLDNSVFEGLANLEKVEIGNSVNSIGDRAFANCPKLTDVTFHTPLIGYEGFTIGTDAFKTGSSELTMHGDIVQGYAPFEFATGKESGKIDDSGRRICYKSQAPSSLTVMYDNKSEEVVLLNYPKFGSLDKLYADHCDDMEEAYYAKYGGGTFGPNDDGDNVYNRDCPYDANRAAFRQILLDIENGTSSYTSVEEAYKDPSYGPWIDENFVALMQLGADFTNAEMDVTASPTIGFKRYFDTYPYSIQENYSRGYSDMDYQMVTTEEQTWVDACLNIVVPSGVTSIDAAGFFNANENNWNISTYFSRGTDDARETYLMCTTKGTDSDTVPGLFSGCYEDYEEDDQEKIYETETRGNDRILSITLNSVKSLPDYAFDSCERLERVTLGPDCAEMGKAPFRGCDSMTEMGGNDYFTADNRIIYSVNEDGSYTIKECLPSRGDLNSNSSPFISTSSDPNLANVSAIVDGAFEDCDFIRQVDLTDATAMQIIPENCFYDCDSLRSVTLPKTVNRIDSKAFNGVTNDEVTVTIPGKEVHIVSDAFPHPSNCTIQTYRGTSAADYALYYAKEGMNLVYLDEVYTVEFFDSISGERIGEIQYVAEGTYAVAPEAPAHEGYVFAGWTQDVSKAPVTSNMTIFTKYVREGEALPSGVPNPSGSGAPNPSGSGNGSPRPTGSGSNSNNSSSRATATPSATPTATPADGRDVTKYTVTVSGGSGSGQYAAGQVVPINAYAMGTGQVFDKWTTSTAGVGFADATATSTTFTMPASNVAITATYKTGNGTVTTASTGGGNGGTSTGSTSGNGTSVEVTRPGFSNTGLAGATVSGATDNFIVKVTEDQAATEAATAALQARFGDLSRIKYFPMDISLYDSTGRTKIADTSGISVNLTLPLPDELVQYAGNNKIAAIAGGALEDLNERFTTVDGVPCINFTATHFSPYVIYVDTANLTEATIDSTPKTGDPIHPKWFLALGMACISLVLFFKRDKALVSARTS